MFFQFKETTTGSLTIATFRAGLGSETFRYLKRIKRQTIKVISSQMRTQLILVTKLPLSVPVSYIINDFRHHCWLALRLTGYGKAVMSRILRTPWLM